MKFFRPHFKIATLAGKQDRLLNKIGGLPWGLPEKYWPHCCGRPQNLLAQLRHEPPMLDLGAPGAVLHLFQCMECGGIDECGRGVVLLNEADLGKGLVEIEGYNLEPELGNPQIGELWIDGWEGEDDGIPSERLSEFFDEDSVRKLHEEFPLIEWYDSRENTKFGGTPRWTGNGPSFLALPFEFWFQLDNYLFLDGLPPAPNEVGCMVTTYYPKAEKGGSEQFHLRPDAGHIPPNAPWGIMHERGADYHYVRYTNFGSDGTAYVFIDRTRRPHEVRWLWSR